MPSLRNSLVDLDAKRWQRIDPTRAPVGHPAPFIPMPAPEPPVAIRRSPGMISSLPPIAQSVDGVTRQFYGGANFPTRRLVTPG
jgi:hypothetical protein